jgi:hypothetical protein
MSQHDKEGNAMANDLDEAAVKKLVEDWYKALDVHAPVDEVVSMVAANGLECYWPEGPTFGVDEFKGWYDKVTHLFFDEVHTLKTLEITPRGNEADVKLVVNWQAKVWNPPDAKSKWLGMDARQTWVVKRSDDGSGAVILKYIVDGMDLMPGSSQL